MNPVLQFDNVARSYTAGVPVLDGVSFQVNEGEVVGLIGRNGTGKTTLLQIAMGMLAPHRGSVRVFGLSPTEFPVEVKSRIGYVSENQVLPPGASVRELVEFHAYLFPKWDRAIEKDLLDRFQLSPKARIGKLSKGQARQVALLLAICHRPDLLILDEPAGGLDPAARREFLEASIQLLNRDGSSILFSSHHMNDIERIGARVVLLDQGRIRLNMELDRMREDVCVMMIPKRSVTDVSVLERLPGCLGVRSVADDWHAVFDDAPETIAARLNGKAGFEQILCVRAPLEELFVELVGK
ncbi:MAG: ABC transporter ATP-binding protein [Acidobacteriota bacterium]